MSEFPQSYPYLPEGREIRYVSEDDPFIRQAKDLRETLAVQYPGIVATASVVVSEGVAIGRSTNNPVHKTFCPRTALMSPSGEGYEWCPKYCHADNHSEAGAIRQALNQSHQSVDGGSLYLYGHWWLCKPCWDKIIAAGIKDVFLVEDATRRFYQAVSGKGEPKRNVKIFFDGPIGNHNPPIDELLARVSIFRVETSRAADFVFPSSELFSTGEFLLRLSEALEKSGLYRIH